MMFLRNERSMGVKNGTLGTLERIEGSSLTVRLDGAEGRAVGFDLKDYAARRSRLRGDDPQGAGRHGRPRARARLCAHGPACGLCRADPSSGGAGAALGARGSAQPRRPRSGAVARAGEGHDARLPGRLCRAPRHPRSRLGDHRLEERGTRAGAGARRPAARDVRRAEAWRRRRSAPGRSSRGSQGEAQRLRRPAAQPGGLRRGRARARAAGAGRRDVRAGVGRRRTDAHGRAAGAAASGASADKGWSRSGPLAAERS